MRRKNRRLVVDYLKTYRAMVSCAPLTSEWCTYLTAMGSCIDSHAVGRLGNSLRSLEFYGHDLVSPRLGHVVGEGYGDFLERAGELYHHVGGIRLRLALVVWRRQTP